MKSGCSRADRMISSSAARTSTGPVDGPVVDQGGGDGRPDRIGFGDRGPHAPEQILGTAPPVGAARDHTGAARHPGLLKAVVHEPAERLEVPVHCSGLLATRVEDQRVLLVGEHALLVAGLAAEGQPRPGARRPAELVGSEIEQSKGERVDRDGEDVCHLERVDARLHESARDLRRGAERLDRHGTIRRALDASPQCERVVLLRREQIDVRHDAEQTSVPVFDRDVMDAAFEHDRGDLGERRLARDGDDRGGRRVGGRGPRAPTLGEHAGPEVAVGDDRQARGAIGLEQHVSLSLVGHDLRGLPDRRGRGHRDRAPADERRDRRLAMIDALRIDVVQRALIAATERGREEQESATGCHHVLRDLLVDQVADRILVCAGRERRARIGQQGDEAEDLSLTEHVDQVAALEELDRSATHDVEETSGLPGLLQDRGTRREELDVCMADDLLHPLVAEVVEGWIHPQERRNVHEPEYRTVPPAPFPRAPRVARGYPRANHRAGGSRR